MHTSKSEIKLLRSLSQRKIREQRKLFLVEGWRALKDALNSGFRIEFVAMTSAYLKNPDYRTFVQETEQRHIPLKELTEIELRQVSETVHAQGVIALVHQKTAVLGEFGGTKASLVVVADRVADPGNMGSLIRTCDWFGVDGLILTEGCVDLYNEKVIRSTVGSIFHVPILDHADPGELIKELKSSGFTVVGTAGDGRTSYANLQEVGKLALVVGSEANGLSPAVRSQCDEVVRIERRGKAESLNVVVACGIILSHIQSSN